VENLTKIKDFEVMLESLYKLEKKITSTTLTLRLESETHVPDLMTRIRILPTVAVVAQADKVARFMDGDAMLTISIKFLPKTTEIYSSIKKLSAMIKNLPGVKSISVDKYNKKKITLRGSKIIF
jgi:hypothetical protein